MKAMVAVIMAMIVMVAIALAGGVGPVFTELALTLGGL